MPDSENLEKTITRLRLLCIELQMDEETLYATPITIEAFCTVCGRLLTTTYYDSNEEHQCRFCPDCYKTVTKGGQQTAKCIEHPQHLITPLFHMRDVTDDLNTVLVRCPHRCECLYGLRRIWEHQDKCRKNRLTPAQKSKLSLDEKLIPNTKNDEASQIQPTEAEGERTKEHSQSTTKTKDTQNSMEKFKARINEEIKKTTEEIRDVQSQQKRNQEGFNDLQEDIHKLNDKVQKKVDESVRHPSMTATDVDHPTNAESRGEPRMETTQRNLKAQKPEDEGKDDHAKGQGGRMQTNL